MHYNVQLLFYKTTPILTFHNVHYIISHWTLQSLILAFTTFYTGLYKNEYWTLICFIIYLNAYTRLLSRILFDNEFYFHQVKRVLVLIVLKNTTLHFFPESIPRQCSPERYAKGCNCRQKVSRRSLNS